MTISFGGLLAGLICILGIPIHQVLCFLIKAGSPGPALFRARRLGMNGMPFDLLKYRTMKIDMPAVMGAGFKMLVEQEDPRVTTVGKWLRSGIDEVPQLWNIVRGEMKWVGPRPDEVWMLPHYGPVCKQRLTVFPGVTGLAQVLDARHIPTADGFAIDLWYIAHRSFWLDAWIVFVTPLFMAGWRSIGRSRLKKLRCSPEFEQYRGGCDLELAAAEAASPDSGNTL